MDILKGNSPGRPGPHPALRPSYRIYFRGGADRIVGREDFEAESDEAAMRLAVLLYEACSDVAQGFELWQGGRRVDGLPPHRRPSTR